MEKQTRTFDVQAGGLGGEKRAEGYAATFERPYVLFEDFDGNKVYEVIGRNAFDGAEMTDVIMQYDHVGKVLARTGNGTLALETDSVGLKISADLSGSRAARDLHEEIKARLITKMSFGFTVAEESWDRATHTRKILRFKRIFDVSAVSFPANENTEIEARKWGAGGHLIRAADSSAPAEMPAPKGLELLKLKLKLFN